MRCFVLAAEGYAAVEAHDGVEALERMSAEGPPALAVIDMMMPRMDGEELIAKMHANPALANTPIAVLSGRGIDTLVHGVSAQLVKPVEIGELLSVVQKLSQRTTSAA